MQADPLDMLYGAMGVCFYRILTVVPDRVVAVGVECNTRCRVSYVPCQLLVGRVPARMASKSSTKRKSHVRFTAASIVRKGCLGYSRCAWRCIDTTTRLISCVA